MADIVSPLVRSRMMAGIRGRNTRPELVLRKALFAKGFRYRIHGNKLPGKPDIVLPKHRSVIFVHGCFWHGHDCSLFKWPGTRADFWKIKIIGNRERDARNVMALLNEGWRVGTVYECALRGPGKFDVQTIADRCETWLVGRQSRLEIAGRK